MLADRVRLAATVAGLAAAAVLVGRVGGDAAAWIAAVPLLVAGLGGGMVTSSNVTLTLEHIPVAMAGAAGGALQTAQRIGAAVLATIFYCLLGRAGHDYAAAVRDTVLCASAFMVAALLLAVADLTGHRRRVPVFGQLCAAIGWLSTSSCSPAGHHALPRQRRAAAHISPARARTIQATR